MLSLLLCIKITRYASFTLKLRNDIPDWFCALFESQQRKENSEKSDALRFFFKGEKSVTVRE